jgi:hypothetical protein
MSASSLGIADIPMRLLITAVVASISIPLVWSAYTDLSLNNTVASVESEIMDLLEIIQDVMDGGVGSTLETEMELSSWGNARINGVRIGSGMNETNSSERYLISYFITGYGRGFVSLDPPIPLYSQYGIDLTEGKYRLRVTHGSSEEGDHCFLGLV